ncbi:GyrI-like domain-containing protein [Sporosarcina sp. FA9]|uniref:GyrI-like domain-containing protein n=1 Tax=Sporosarcina sp. FA9 TaxID=3413030 RepID=UPI003F65586A
MDTRIVEVEAFSVRGFDRIGPLTMIPELWENFNSALAENEIHADESFGVCLRAEKDEFHYIAGINSTILAGLANSIEVTIPKGKFIVGLVEDGVHEISASFETLMQRKDIQFRPSYALERYVHPKGSTGFEIEVWLPIE